MLGFLSNAAKTLYGASYKVAENAYSAAETAAGYGEEISDEIYEDVTGIPAYVESVSESAGSASSKWLYKTGDSIAQSTGELVGSGTRASVSEYVRPAIPYVIGASALIAGTGATVYFLRKKGGKNGKK